jgi:hypothetical protein
VCAKYRKLVGWCKNIKTNFIQEALQTRIYKRVSLIIMIIGDPLINSVGVL